MLTLIETDRTFWATVTHGSFPYTAVKITDGETVDIHGVCMIDDYIPFGSQPLFDIKEGERVAIFKRPVSTGYIDGPCAMPFFGNMGNSYIRGVAKVGSGYSGYYNDNYYKKEDVLALKKMQSFSAIGRSYGVSQVPYDILGNETSDCPKQNTKSWYECVGTEVYLDGELTRFGYSCGINTGRFAGWSLYYISASYSDFSNFSGTNDSSAYSIWLRSSDGKNSYMGNPSIKMFYTDCEIPLYHKRTVDYTEKWVTDDPPVMLKLGSINIMYITREQIL